MSLHLKVTSVRHAGASYLVNQTCSLSSLSLQWLMHISHSHTTFLSLSHSFPVCSLHPGQSWQWSPALAGQSVCVHKDGSASCFELKCVLAMNDWLKQRPKLHKHICCFNFMWVVRNIWFFCTPRWNHMFGTSACFHQGRLRNDAYGMISPQGMENCELLLLLVKTKRKNNFLHVSHWEKWNWAQSNTIIEALLVMVLMDSFF